MWQRFSVLVLMCAATSAVGYFAMATAPRLFAPGPLLFFAIGSWLEQFVSLGRYGLLELPPGQLQYRLNEVAGLQ